MAASPLVALWAYVAAVFFKRTSVGDAGSFLGLVSCSQGVLSAVNRKTSQMRILIGSIDGRVVQTISPKDREDMEKKLMRYKNNVTTAEEKVTIAKEKLSEKNSKLQGLQEALKSAQQNAALAVNLLQRRKSISSTSRAQGKPLLPDGTEGDRSLARVNDVIGCLDKVARKRREQHDQKKTGRITSTWLEAHPDLPSSFKKSLW